MKILTSKKIKTKNQALQLLDNLCIVIKESMYFSNDFENDFYRLALQQMVYMQNSINHSEDFFNHFFKNKTKEEIIDWIEEESKRWG